MKLCCTTEPIMPKFTGRLILLLAVVLTVTAAQAQVPIPEKDAPSTQPPVKYLGNMVNKHPRLLLTAETLPRVKAFYDSPEGKIYRDEIEAAVRRGNVPNDRKMGDDWGRAQGIGLFGLPPVAVHYALTKDKDSFEKGVAYLKWLAGQPDWTKGGGPAVPDTAEAYAKVMDTMLKFEPQGERNSDIAAAFTMVGATMVWDYLYNDLDPQFREQFRQILWNHARAMYYNGFIKRVKSNSYYFGAPNYNHRWFRVWGMSMAALATAEGKPEEQAFLGIIEKELKFNFTWLPVDGSQHEGPGYGGSAGGLGMALQISDDLTGTHYLDAPFFANVGSYAVNISTPGMNECFYFADTSDKTCPTHAFFLKAAAMHKQADVLDGLRKSIAINFKKFGIGNYAWLAILSDDPSIKGGDYHKLPTAAFLPDDGIAIVRDSWADDAVAARFKCGPLGGYASNAWTKSADVGERTRPNVAHDHPDANSFVLFGGGQFLAESDRYDDSKLSRGDNTILINGVGQAPQGEPEGAAWMQPGTGDLTQTARIVAYKDAGQFFLTEGEAAGCYLAIAKGDKTRPALDRFRRTFIWDKGNYVLVFDDVRAPSPVDITWLIEGAKLEPINEAEGCYRLAKGDMPRATRVRGKTTVPAAPAVKPDPSKPDAQCEFQLVSDLKLQSKIGESPAKDRGNPLKWPQLQATANGAAAHFACVLDPWHKNVKVSLTLDGPDKATIKVTGDGINDTWQWEAAKGKFEAATWHGPQNLTIDAKNAVPPAP